MKILKIKIMDNNKLFKAENMIASMEAAGRVKKIKTDKSIIERADSAKIILTEDNKQLLND